MTHIAPTPTLPTLTARDIIGPYSPWPRQTPRKSPRVRRVAGAVATLGGLGVFVHCGLPLIV